MHRFQLAKRDIVYENVDIGTESAKLLRWPTSTLIISPSIFRSHCVQSFTPIKGLTCEAGSMKQQRTIKMADGGKRLNVSCPRKRELSSDISGHHGVGTYMGQERRRSITRHATVDVRQKAPGIKT